MENPAADSPNLQTRFNEYRNLLFSIAYRMVGSVADAEDLVQETFIRWQQACHEDIRSPRAFLITIVSRLSINHLQSARAQREQYVGQWLPEPMVTDPSSDPSNALWSDESLSMAFLVLEVKHGVEATETSAGHLLDGDGDCVRRHGVQRHQLQSREPGGPDERRVRPSGIP